MRWCCAAILTLSCSLSGMELETLFSYYAERISSVQLSDQKGTILALPLFLTVYTALLKLRSHKGQPHLRDIFNKCRTKYYNLHPKTISIVQKPLQLVNGQFQDPGIESLCSFVLEKYPDCPLRGWPPVTVRAPKNAIAKVELKKKDENRLD